VILTILGLLCLGLYGSLFIVGFALIPLGAWVAITGKSEAGEPKPPLWWRVVAGVLAAAGTAGGFYLSVVIEK
jgi:hypothetical protein